MTDAKQTSIRIRYVLHTDKDFWFSLDKHISPAEFDKKARDRMGYILLKDDCPLALLRYHLFWDNTPFCTMLCVKQEAQKAGLGRCLMTHWENEMRATGYTMVMTSSQADEGGQHFYRKLGYMDAGALIIPIKGHAQPTELFFIKDLQ